jgi:hypothetical protein
MRRFGVSLLVASALAAGCGAAKKDAPAPAPATTGPTQAELAAREKLLAEIKRGELECYCTAAERARERIAKGLAADPSRGG